MDLDKRIDELLDKRFLDEYNVRVAMLQLAKEVAKDCAQIADDEVAKIRRYDSDGKMKSECGALVTIAHAVRRKYDL